MSWTHLEDTEPRARRDYQCELCGLRIRKGAKHISRRGISDGRMSTFRMHAICESLARRWEDDDWYTREYSEFQRYELELPRVQQYAERRPMLSVR